VVVLSGGVLRRGLGVGIAADLNKRSKQGIMDTKLVLAAVDFSPVSDEVCRVAANLAASIGARAVVLHVSEPEVDYVGVAPPELFPMTQDTAVQVIEGRLRAARVWRTRRRRPCRRAPNEPSFAVETRPADAREWQWQHQRPRWWQYQWQGQMQWQLTRRMSTRQTQ
jgi:hypothetical protein